jgi:hypothetical protein
MQAVLTRPMTDSKPAGIGQRLTSHCARLALVPIQTKGHNMRKITLLAAAFLAMPAFANELATNDAITAAVSGNSIQGNMTASGPYAEFYAADGTIKGAGYSAKWTVEDDKMCFTYEGAAPDCWGVRVDGAQVTWVKDGADGGTGTIVAGNPNNF